MNRIIDYLGRSTYPPLEAPGFGCVAPLPYLSLVKKSSAAPLIRRKAQGNHSRRRSPTTTRQTREMITISGPPVGNCEGKPVPYSAPNRAQGSRISVGVARPLLRPAIGGTTRRDGRRRPAAGASDGDALHRAPEVVCGLHGREGRRRRPGPTVSARKRTPNDDMGAQHSKHSLLFDVLFVSSGGLVGAPSMKQPAKK